MDWRKNALFAVHRKQQIIEVSRDHRRGRDYAMTSVAREQCSEIATEVRGTKGSEVLAETFDGSLRRDGSNVPVILALCSCIEHLGAVYKLA